MDIDTVKMRLFPLYRLACRDVCCHLKGNKTYLTWSQSLTFQDQELSLSVVMPTKDLGNYLPVCLHIKRAENPGCNFKEAGFIFPQRQFR